MNYSPNNNNAAVSIWCWQDDDGEYKPYPLNISQKIHTLNVGGMCMLIISNIQYEIKRVSADAAVQTNMNDGLIRLVILQTINNNISNTNSSNYHWYWQYNKSYKPFNEKDSKKLDKLSVGASYAMYIRGTKYEIRKTSNDSGKQTNTKTNTQRNIFRKIKSNDNQTDRSTSDDYKNEAQCGNVWCWDNNGSYKPYTKAISQKVDKLQIGQSYTTKFGNDSYEITKISNTKCQQKNMRTQFARNVTLQSAQNDQDTEDDKEEKQEVERWYWKNDNGEFKQCGYNISKTICGLAVGDMKKIKIQNKWYEFKKTGIDKCAQTNSKTGKIREVRVAVYGWYYKASDGTFMSYTDEVNKQLDSASIGDTVTFSVNKNKYCVTKKSKNSAEQNNISSNKKRTILRQLALNKDAGNRNIVPKDKVDELFHASVAKSHNITEVQDLTKNSQNSVIYEKILQEKCKHGRKRENVEMYLWHGTKDLSNLKLIIKNGFDRSFNKAAAYGKGTYFAKEANYSVSGGYCGKDSSNVHHILLCKVIVGDYTVGSSSTKSIPTKADGTEYETLVNSKTNPTIFVVWRDYHAVPCYLVKYK